MTDTGARRARAPGGDGITTGVRVGDGLVEALGLLAVSWGELSERESEACFVSMVGVLGRSTPEIGEVSMTFPAGVGCVGKADEPDDPGVGVMSSCRLGKAGIGDSSSCTLDFAVDSAGARKRCGLSCDGECKLSKLSPCRGGSNGESWVGPVDSSSLEALAKLCWVRLTHEGCDCEFDPLGLVPSERLDELSRRSISVREVLGCWSPYCEDTRDGSGEVPRSDCELGSWYALSADIAGKPSDEVAVLFSSSAPGKAGDRGRL